jgi:hypothetical protein
MGGIIFLENAIGTGAMPTLAVGMLRFSPRTIMPTASVGMAPAKGNARR